MHFEALNCELLAVKVNFYFTSYARVNLCSVLVLVAGSMQKSLFRLQTAWGDVRSPE